MAGLDGYGIAVLAFLALSLTVGTLTSRLVKKSSKRYMIAGKSLPLFFVGTMLAAQSIDGNSSLGNVSLVYQFGFWSGAAIPIGLAACLILTAIFYAKKLNKMSMLTLPDFYFRRFGNASEGISGILMMVSFVVLVAGNFAATGYILSVVLHIDFIWAMLIGAIIVLIYTYAGGLFSSARDGKTARRGAFMGAGLTILTIVPTSMMGIVALYFLPDLVDPYTAYPDLAINHVPFVIGLALLMGVLGASMSTANGGLLAISSVMSRNIVQRNIMKRILKRPGMGDRKLLMVTRIFTIPMMIAAFVLAYMIPQPGVYLILAFDIVFAGAWAPLTFGLFWKKANTPATLASLIIGSSLRLLLFFVIPVELAGLDTLIPPVVSVIIFVVVALTTQRKYPGRYGIVDYIPPEEDVLNGEDLKGFVAPSAGK